MNLCRIGIHDWEEVSDRVLLWEKVKEFLTSLGFTTETGLIGDLWLRGELSIPEYAWCGDLDYQIPVNPISKVCLRCGKVHKNYSEAKVISKVHDLVLEKEAELSRRKKAEEMLGRSK